MLIASRVNSPRYVNGWKHLTFSVFMKRRSIERSVWDGGSIEEQFAPYKNRLLIYTVPHNCHGKRKSLTAKANHSRQEQTCEARVNGKHGVSRCPSVKSNNISIKSEQTGKMVQTDFVYWRKRFDVVIYLCKHERIMSLIAVYHNKQTRDTKYY